MQLTASMFYFIPTPLLLFILGTTYKFYLALVYSRIATLFNHKTNDTRVKPPPHLNDRGLKSGKIFLYENTLRDEKRNTSVGIKRGLRNGGKGSSVFRVWWCIAILLIFIPYNHSVSKSNINLISI